MAEVGSPSAGLGMDTPPGRGVTSLEPKAGNKGTRRRGNERLRPITINEAALKVSTLMLDPLMVTLH